MKDNIKPTSSSSTAQINTQLQNETFKPLDGASCSASDILEKYGASSLQELYDAYKMGEGWFEWLSSQTPPHKHDPDSGYVLLRTDLI